MGASTNIADLVKNEEKNEPGVLRQVGNIAFPILEREDIGYHVEQILKYNPQIRKAVEQKPYLRDVLGRYVERTVQDYKWLLYGAKTVDSIDKIAAVVELGAGAFGPQAEVGIKVVTESLEAVTKIPYVSYYAGKTGDYVGVLYFAAAEAASLIPYVGEAVDVMHVYTNRLRSQLQKKAAKDFLENIVVDKKNDVRDIKKMVV